MSATHHEQTRITHENASAYVDVGIAPLILALWRHRIPTHASCQGDPPLCEQDPGRDASISFPAGWAADAFVKLVRPWQLACEIDPQRHPQGGWTWRAGNGFPFSDGIERLMVHVFFPPSDLPTITAAAENPDARTFGEWLDDRHTRRDGVI
jgi:hypothetical protein